MSVNFQALVKSIYDEDLKEMRKEKREMEIKKYLSKEDLLRIESALDKMIVNEALCAFGLSPNKDRIRYVSLVTKKSKCKNTARFYEELDGSLCGIYGLEDDLHIEDLRNMIIDDCIETMKEYENV